MAIDLKAPIDVSAVQLVVRQHGDVLKAVDKLDAAETLANFTPMSGITDSIELGKVEGGSISSKYNGIFLGDKNLGKIVPRRLIVRPVVAEMSDEPERYRRSYFTEVPGGQRTDHPFEVWLIQHGLTLASNDLNNVILSAKYDSAEDKLGIEDSFDGVGTIIEHDKVTKAEGAAAGDPYLISEANKNLFVTGVLSRANIGDQLLKMWREMPVTFRRKDSIFIISDELGDLYDDWLKDESNIITLETESAGNQFLRGTKGKAKLVRITSYPENSGMVILTTKPNVVYGYDKAGDMKNMVPFVGNPYKFQATMKYVIGFQFISIHKSEFCVNDQPLTPVKVVG